MFKHPPKILSHISSVNDGNFVTPEYILNKGDDNINLFRRLCPHRAYPISEPGKIIKNIRCNFHGFEWNKNGDPINNNRTLNCGNAEIGKSGLIFKDFIEPNHKWVDDLSKEKGLKFSHACRGTSKGSWLWMMEIQADLLHVQRGDDVIHPVLSGQVDLDSIIMESGDGWILQTHPTGWWLFIYPYTFVEWSLGCVSINYTIPHNTNNEFGFDWITQFFFNDEVTEEKRKDFELIEDVFKEDVEAIEKQHGGYFPLFQTDNRLEEHCVHYANWVHKNRLK